MKRPDKITNLKDELKQVYSLIQDETDALVKFKASDCRGLNTKIRGDNLNSSEKILCKNLSDGLLKIPSTKEGIIYRHLDFREEQLEMAKQFFQAHLGQRIRFKEFQSCSLRECLAGNHAYHNWSMKITISQLTNAKDIYSLWTKHGLNDVEEEILMLNNSCFEIQSVDFKAHVKVHLKEVPCDLQIEPVPEF